MHPHSLLFKHDTNQRYQLKAIYGFMSGTYINLTATYQRMHVRVNTSVFSEWTDFNRDVIRNRILPSDVEFTGVITQPPCNAYCNR